MLEPSRRSLTAAERRLLRARIHSLAARRRRGATASLVVPAAVVFVLWFWTIVASDAPWPVVTAFWLVAGGGITMWVRRDMRIDAGHEGAMARRLESALRRDAADVFDVRARAFAAFEEVEDEGACYAFEIDGGRVVFISGQEFYAGARWPTLDFAVVYPVDERNAAADFWIEKRGEKASPSRTIPAAVKRHLDLPDHLATVDGGLDGLESRLGRSRRQ